MSTELQSDESTNRTDNSDADLRKQRRVIWAMTVILGVSLVTNVLLAYKIRQANVNVAYLASRPSKPPTLPIGTTLQPLKVNNLDGQPAVISYADSNVPVVLYVFTPECPWCSRNLDNFKSLLSQKHDAYRFVALSLTDKDVKDYIAQSQLDLPTFMGLSEEDIHAYKLGSTPQTIVISPDGKIVENWVGAYIGPNQTDVERFFGVRLPGVKPPK